MRLPILPILLILGFYLEGCYVPPVWDIGDEIHDLGQVEEGTSTRKEVVDLLGEPHHAPAEGAIWRYYGDQSKGVIAIPHPLGRAWVLDAERWDAMVVFDNQDRVLTVLAYAGEPSPRRSRRFVIPPGKEDINRLQAAFVRGEVTVEALYTFVHVVDDVVNVTPSGFTWPLLCLAVHSDHAGAQRLVGSDAKDRAELVPAYVWLSLAEKNGSSSARYHRDRITPEMRPEQVAEAERLAAEWRPNPAECEVEPAQSGN